MEYFNHFIHSALELTCYISGPKACCGNWFILLTLQWADVDFIEFTSSYLFVARDIYTL